MDGNRPQHVRSVEAQLRITLPNWAIVELERHSAERPDESLDRFVSELIRQWAERRQAGRLRGSVSALTRP